MKNKTCLNLMKKIIKNYDEDSKKEYNEKNYMIYTVIYHSCLKE